MLFVCVAGEAFAGVLAMDWDGSMYAAFKQGSSVGVLLVQRVFGGVCVDIEIQTLCIAQARIGKCEAAFILSGPFSLLLLSLSCV